MTSDATTARPPARRAGARPLAGERALARDAERLYAALTEIIRIYMFRDRDRICCHDISLSQCHALDALAAEGPLTLNELAARLYLDKSTTSRIVDALERKGYVRRREHPEDRRAVLLEPTPAGARLHARIREAVLEDERRLLQDFEPAVRRGLVRLLDRLARAAAARVEASGGSCCRIE